MVGAGFEKKVSPSILDMFNLRYLLGPKIELSGDH
jgi:hypothetical protein